MASNGIGAGPARAGVGSSAVYRGERVVTLRQVDEVHGLAEGRTRKNFAEHREEMKEGVHYHLAPAGTTSEIRTSLGGPSQGGGRDLILLTERGYLWLATTFRGPLAARVRALGEALGRVWAVATVAIERGAAG